MPRIGQAKNLGRHTEHRLVGLALHEGENSAH